MLPTCLAALAVSLHVGDVVTIPAATPLVVPGLVNWALRDPSFLVPPGARASVARIAPEKLRGVVEVKLTDGTGRLGWVEEDKLSALSTGGSTPAQATATPSTDHPEPAKDRGTFGGPRVGHRKGHLPDFSAVDAQMAAMGQAAFKAQRTSSIGLSIYKPTIYRPPVYDVGSTVVGPRSPAVGSHICGKPNRSKPGFCQRLVRDGGACPEHGA